MWEDIDLTGVNPNLEPVGEGAYDFQLRGAKVITSESGSRLAVTATVITEGDFTGRSVTHTFFPGEYTAKFLKRLEIALGVDALPGEKNQDYLNRVAGNRFNAVVKHRPSKDNPEVKYTEFNPWTFRATA